MSIHLLPLRQSKQWAKALIAIEFLKVAVHLLFPEGVVSLRNSTVIPHLGYGSGVS